MFPCPSSGQLPGSVPDLLLEDAGDSPSYCAMKPLRAAPQPPQPPQPRHHHSFYGYVEDQPQEWAQLDYYTEVRPTRGVDTHYDGLCFSWEICPQLSLSSSSSGALDCSGYMCINSRFV